MGVFEVKVGDVPTVTGDAARGMEISWRTCQRNSSLVCRTLAEAILRRRLGLSLVAIIRRNEINQQPDFAMVFEDGDTVCLLGTKEQVACAEALFVPAQSRMAEVAFSCGWFASHSSARLPMEPTRTGGSTQVPH